LGFAGKKNHFFLTKSSFFEHQRNGYELKGFLYHE